MLNAISLFSCIGVSEYYLKSIGVNVVCASDIDPKRCEVHKFFYPRTKVVCGNICDDDVKQDIIDSVGKKRIDLVISTPPCQGMSTAGKNRGDVTLGKTDDSRNYLILESFKIIDHFSPSFILFENVPRILKVTLPYQGEWLSVKEILERKYGDDYNIDVDIFNAADYGVPQSRERAFIRLSKKNKKWNPPIKSKDIITLRDAIGEFPSLNAGESSPLKNHWARKHPAEQVEWMSHTPTGCSAFDNKRYFPCKKDGVRIKGFHNTYKRMDWDKPAPTVTMRNEIMSSQENIHPGRLLDNGLWSDARVLTLREILTIMSLPPDLDLPTFVSDTLLRQYIGEGIPSLLMKRIVEGIVCPKKK